MVAYKSLKLNKGNVQLGNPKSGRGRLRERSHTGAFYSTKFTSQFKWGFAKVVVTRAGRLREWSQGELRLYTISLASVLNRVITCRSSYFVFLCPKLGRGVFFLPQTGSGFQIFGGSLPVGRHGSSTPRGT